MHCGFKCFLFHSTSSLLKSESIIFLGFFFPFSVADPSLTVCVDSMQKPLNVAKEMQWLLQ